MLNDSAKVRRTGEERRQPHDCFFIPVEGSAGCIEFHSWIARIVAFPSRIEAALALLSNGHRISRFLADDVLNAQVERVRHSPIRINSRGRIARVATGIAMAYA